MAKNKAIDEAVSMELAKEFYKCIESYQYPKDILFLAGKRACCSLREKRSWGIGQGEFYREPNPEDVIQTIYNEINDISDENYCEYTEPLASLIKGLAWHKAAEAKSDEPGREYEKSRFELIKTLNDFRKCKKEIREGMKEGLSYHEAQKSAYPTTEEGYVEKMFFIDGHEINPLKFYALIRYLKKDEQKAIVDKIEKTRENSGKEDLCIYCDCDEIIIKKAFSKKELFEMASKIGSRMEIVKHLPPGGYEKAKETFFELLKDHMYGIWSRAEKNAYKLSSDSQWF